MAVSSVVAEDGPAARLDEAVFRLIDDAAAYLRGEGAARARPASLHAAVEITRLTARLTDLAAWVLGRKAYERGEIDVAAYRQRFALLAAPLHLAPLRDAHREHLPVALIALLERSLGLYQRVNRLQPVR